MQSWRAPTTQPARHGAGSRALSAGIAGASGYSGRELARLIAGHPQLTLRTAQARSEGFDALSPEELARCDVAFLCLPHGASRPFGEAIARAGTPVVDLGSDFRLDPDWAYGLTELFRQDVLDSRQIANPGCYATAATLALAPLAEAGPARRAGRDRRQVGRLGRRPRADRAHARERDRGRRPAVQARPGTATSPRSSARSPASPARPVPVTFTPHLAPHSRGLEVTCYARLRRPLDAGRGRRALPRALRRGAVRLGRAARAPGPAARRQQLPRRASGSTSARRRRSAPLRSTTSSRARPGRRIQNANLVLGLDEGAGLTALGLGV